MTATRCVLIAIDPELPHRYLVYLVFWMGECYWRKVIEPTRLSSSRVNPPSAKDACRGTGKWLAPNPEVAGSQPHGRLGDGTGSQYLPKPAGPWVGSGCFANGSCAVYQRAACTPASTRS
jgi:hypothetical protein